MYSLPFIGRELLPLRIVAPYKLNSLPYFFPCGTKFHTIFINAGHVANGEALDRRRLGNPCVDHVDAQTTNHDQSTCTNEGDYTGSDETSEECIATVRLRSKGRKSRRFIMHFIRAHPNHRSRSNRHDIFETVYRGPFHRNR